MVVSLIALVFSISGSAVAAHQYLLTSINQIRPGVLAQIRSKAAVQPAAVAGPAGTPGANGAAGKDGSPGIAGPPGSGGLTGSPGSTGSAGPEGRQGERGAQGETGPRGETGAPGFVSGLAIGEQHIELGYGGGFGSAEATCPRGTAPVSGGWRSTHQNIDQTEPAPRVDAFTSERTERGWLVEAINDENFDGGVATLTVFVECAEP
jgi:hypothetical protein